MTRTIIPADNARLAKVEQISISRNGRYLVWTFKTIKTGELFKGFSSSTVVLGNKTYIWYCILCGSFIPPSYTIDLNYIKDKQVYIVLSKDQTVQSLIPVKPLVDTTLTANDLLEQEKEVWGDIPSQD